MQLGMVGLGRIGANMAALFARFASRQDDPPTMEAVGVLRDRFGGYGTRS